MAKFDTLQILAFSDAGVVVSTLPIRNTIAKKHLNVLWKWTLIRIGA